jgi:serine/threonine-protein kinase RsbW
VELEARLSVWLPATKIAATMVRQVARSLAPTVPETREEDLGLVLTELVTNSVRHAEIEADNSVSVELFLFSDLLRVEVRDRGRAFEPPPPPQPGERPSSGWGLFIVDQVADRWGVGEEPPTQVWFEFDREQRDDKAA